MTSCYVFLNTASGSVQASELEPDALADGFAARGIDAEIVCPGRDGSFDELLKRARTTGADALVAAGGDGTVTALAGAALAAGKPLAILPLGTANLLARDLGIPLDVASWLDGFTRMAPRPVDAATVNDRLFLHKVVLGLLPGIASARERLRTNAGPLSTLAFAGFVKRRIERLNRMRITIDIDGAGPERHAVSAIAVANNPYDEGIGRVFARERLDSGKLAVYLARRITLADTMRLFGGMAVGNWRQADSFTTHLAETVEIDRGKRLIKAMIDGDPATLTNPLRFAMKRGALSMLAPPPDANSALASVLNLLQTD